MSAREGPRGDGRRETPLRSIADALKRAPDGSTIMLGRGRFVAQVTITRDVIIRGACLDETVLTATPDDAVCIDARGANVEISDLRVEDCASIGIWSQAGSLILERIAVARSGRIGVGVVDGTARLSHVAVADAGRPIATVLTVGIGAQSSTMTLRHVVVERAYRQGIVALLGSDVTIEDSVIRGGAVAVGEEATSVAVVATDSRATLSRSVVTDHPGFGVGALNAGSLSIDHSVVRRCNHGAGVENAEFHAASTVFSNNVRAGLQANTSTVTLDNLVIDQTHTGHDGAAARGFGCEFGTIMTLRRAYISASEGFGGLVTAPGSFADLEDVQVHATRPIASGAFGRALEVNRSGRLRARRLRLTANRQGLVVNGSGSEMEIEDLVATDAPTLPWTLDTDGPIGVSVELGGSFELGRGSISDQPFASVRILGAGAHARISDFQAIRTRSVYVTGAYVGIGLAIMNGATLHGERVRLEDGEGQALLVGGASTAAILTDLTVERTVPAADDIGGYGTVIVDGASVTVDRGRLTGNREAAIAVQAARLEGRDIVIEDTTSRSTDAEGGRGLIVQQGGTALIERLQVARSHDIGVSIAGEGSYAQLRDARITDTRGRRCLSDDTCGGVGVATYLSGRLEMDGFAISDSALCGVLIAADGAVDLRRGRVTRNDIGVCLQVPDYDLERLRSEVSYEDNRRAIDSTDLPVPDNPDLSGP